MKKFCTRLVCLVLALFQTPAAYAAGTLEPLKCDLSFLSPTGIVIREDGTMLVADGGLNSIVSIQNGASSLLAGRTLPCDGSGLPMGGHLDGKAELALFNTPCALIEWNAGLAVSDRDNHCLRQISNGIVRTLAGDGIAGYRDGAAAQARFDVPLGLAAGDDGTLYIADSGNGCIRSLNARGIVSTYLSGLSEPAGLCWYDGALYATDVGTHQVLRIKNGNATVLAGRSEQTDGVFLGGFSDGPAAEAEFSSPFAITVRDGVAYIADTGNSAIRMLRDGWVSTLACYRGSTGDIWPGRPFGLQLKGTTLYIADEFSGVVLKLDTSKQLFQDVHIEDWYAEGISSAYTMDIMQGTSAAYFSPTQPLTRGQAVMLLYRLEKQPEPEGMALFSDIPESSCYAKAIAWATAVELTEGAAADAFLPDKPITREELMTLFYRYASRKGQTITQTGNVSGYEDSGDIQDYAVTPMEWACTEQLIHGVESNRLAPNGIAERGQAAVFITRLVLLLTRHTG